MAVLSSYVRAMVVLSCCFHLNHLSLRSSRLTICSHIHWYERLWPLTGTGAIDTPSIIDNNTYWTNPGVSMTHIINGMAGNIESHSTLEAGQSPLNITAVLDFQHYGFSKLKVINSTALSMSFIFGQDGSVGDEVTLLKKGSGSGSSTSSSTPTGTSTGAATTGSPITYTPPPYVTTTTEVVTAYTTYCPGNTVITQGSSTYSVTGVCHHIPLPIDIKTY
jgi:hypothetical protein